MSIIACLYITVTLRIASVGWIDRLSYSAIQYPTVECLRKLPLCFQFFGFVLHLFFWII